MGTKTESDEVVRRLAEEFRVLTLGGLAVIVTGLSRNTYDAGIWVEPIASPEEWSNQLSPILYASGAAQPVAIGSWEKIGRGNLAGVIGRDGVIRVNVWWHSHRAAPWSGCLRPPRRTPAQSPDIFFHRWPTVRRRSDLSGTEKCVARAFD
jgi:hypothetical protein